MESSNYPSKSETRHQLSVSYNDTFSVLTAEENQHRFTAKEKASFNYIINNHRIETDNAFSVDTWKMGKPSSPQPLAFDFHGRPKDVFETPKDVVSFANAHEIKHASLAYNSYIRGAVNTHTFVHGADKIYQGITKLQKNIPAINFITKPLAYGVKLAKAVFQRHEERLCDRFALRVYPDADIGAQKAFDQKAEEELLSEKLSYSKVKNENSSISDEKRQNTFQCAMQNLKEIVQKYERTHPENDRRYSSLLKIQNRHESPSYK